jgi:hypothetical protein
MNKLKAVSKMKGKLDFKDVSMMKGKLEVKIFKAGKLIEEWKEENLIVNLARTQMSHLIGGDGEDREISQIAFGTNGTTPVVADQTITNAYVKDISEVSFPDETSVQFDWELDTDENNGQAIMEFGLMCANDALFSRRVRTNPIHKADDISIEGHWIISF